MEELAARNFTKKESRRLVTFITIIVTIAYVIILKVLIVFIIRCLQLYDEA